VKELNTMQRDPGLKTIVQIAMVCRDIEVTAKRWAAFLGGGGAADFDDGDGE
jgi:hypothetical protein